MKLLAMLATVKAAAGPASPGEGLVIAPMVGMVSTMAVNLLARLTVALLVKPVAKQVVRPREAMTLMVTVVAGLPLKPKANLVVRLVVKLVERLAAGSSPQTLHTGGTSSVKAYSAVLCRQGGAWHSNQF